LWRNRAFGSKNAFKTHTILPNFALFQGQNVFAENGENPKEAEMLNKNAVFAMAAVALLGACSGIQTTRNSPIETSPTQVAAQSSRSAGWHVTAVNVNVPNTLTVSEANSYIPKADIVWREDPFGDRRAQVKTIVQDSITQALLGMNGVEPVVVDIDLIRFHALSQKTRATFGGWHNVEFNVTVRDADTGVQLADTFEVRMKIRGYGGQAAIEAEMRGETQKVRIEQNLAEVVKQYFAQV